MGKTQVHELSQKDVHAMDERDALSLEAEITRLRSKLLEVETWTSNRLAYLTGRYFVLARVGDVWNLYGVMSRYEVHDKPFQIRLLESNIAGKCDVIEVELNLEGIKQVFMMKAEDGQEVSQALTTCQGAPAVLVVLQVFTDRATAEEELTESCPASFDHTPSDSRTVVDGEESPTVAIEATASASGTSRAAVPTVPAPASSPPGSTEAKVPSAPPAATGLPSVPAPPPSRSKSPPPST